MTFVLLSRWTRVSGEFRWAGTFNHGEVTRYLQADFFGIKRWPLFGLN